MAIVIWYAFLVVWLGWAVWIDIRVSRLKKRIEDLELHALGVAARIDSHCNRIGDQERQVAELQAVVAANSELIKSESAINHATNETVNTRLDTLEKDAYERAKPVEQPRKVIKPSTFTEFKQLVEGDQQG